MAYKNPIGMSPYLIVYGKACHLPVDLEHKAYWAIQQLNFNLGEARTQRKLYLNELEEIHNDIYVSARLYKDQVKTRYDQHILWITFSPGQKVLLYNLRLHLFPNKLKSRWTGPFTVKTVYPYGAVELTDLEKGKIFKVNGQRVKPFLGYPSYPFDDVLLEDLVYND